MPIKRPRDLIAAHDDLLAMLRLHSAEGEKLFSRRFESPIERVAEFINALPGSSSSSFSGAGGLLRACIETAFSAFRSSDGRIFTGALGVEDRHKLEARWRYVCFCSGLLYPIAGALDAMDITAADGSRWAPDFEGLTAWAEGRKQTAVFVTWNHQGFKAGPSASAATFVQALIGRENVEWLHEGSPELMKAMIQIVSGSAAAKRLIAEQVVRDIFAAVVDREDARRPQNYGRLTVGSHISPYLLDALVSLARGKWMLNERVLYADAKGVYLAWPTAGADIIEYCKGEGYQGVPAHEAALLSILVTEGFVVAGVEGVSLVEIADVHGEIQPAVKLKQPALLLPEGTSLGSFAQARPVEMNAVRAADPLNGADQGVEPSTEKPPKSPSKKTAAPTLDQLDIAEVLPPAAEDGETSEKEVDEEEVIEAPVRPAFPPSAPQSTPENDLSGQTTVRDQPAGKPESPGNDVAQPNKQPVKKNPTAAKSSQPPGKTASTQGAVIEAPEIKYSSLLPGEVADRFRPFENEVLGRLVHSWRTQSLDGRLMRMCENGMAVELAMLGEFVKDPVSFLSTLGGAGFLYTAPTTPSKMVYPVPVSDGSTKTVIAFILAHHAIKKLGLP